MPLNKSSEKNYFFEKKITRKFIIFLFDKSKVYQLLSR